jgi:hypothetical protein
VLVALVLRGIERPINSSWTSGNRSSSCRLGSLLRRVFPKHLQHNCLARPLSYFCGYTRASSRIRLQESIVPCWRPYVQINVRINGEQIMNGNTDARCLYLMEDSGILRLPSSRMACLFPSPSDPKTERSNTLGVFRPRV